MGKVTRAAFTRETADVRRQALVAAAETVLAREGVADLVGELVRLEHRAARAHDRAQLLDAEVRDEVLRAVLQKERHAVALSHADAVQRLREGVAQAVELRVADVAAIPDERGLAGLAARVLAQVLVQRLLAEGVVDVDVAHEWHPGNAPAVHAEPVEAPRKASTSSARTVWVGSTVLEDPSRPHRLPIKRQML